MSRRVVASACARAGLLGNPSDGYGGKCIALALGNFAARVTIDSDDGFGIEGEGDDALEVADFRGAHAALRSAGCDAGAKLVRAALKRFADHCAALPGGGPVEALADDNPRLRMRVRFESDIPREVGLAGSSAIVVASLQAMAHWFDVRLHPAEVAELALAAELEELGIAAGPMDRVVQAYGGLVHMDFTRPRSPSSYAALDPSLLPPLLIAWDPGGGAPSGDVHGGARARWLAGDPKLRAGMRIFARLVDEGVGCLRNADAARFRSLMDENFDARAALFPIAARDREMIAIARAHGGGAKLCGSGGAVSVALAQGADRGRVADAFTAAGFRTLSPTPGRAAEALVQEAA